MKTSDVNNRFPTNYGSKQAAHYRSNKFVAIFIFFNTQMLLVNLQRICLGGLGWSCHTVIAITFIYIPLIELLYKPFLYIKNVKTNQDIFERKNYHVRSNVNIF